MLRDPLSPRVDTLDWYQQFYINDPYRWLENISSDSTQRWCRQQSGLTRSYLNGIAQRDGIKNRLDELSRIDVWTVLAEAGSHRLLQKANGSQTSDAIYVQNLDSKNVKLLLDPLSIPNSARASCGYSLLSPKGNFLTYSITRDGGSSREWRCRLVETGVDLDFVIEASCLCWLPDESGFYYTVSSVDSALADASGEQMTLGYRAVSPSSAACSVDLSGVAGDVYSIRLSDDGRYLVIAAHGTRLYSSMRIISLGQEIAPFEPFAGAEGRVWFSGVSAGCLWFHSEDRAPKGKVVAVSRCDGQWQLETVVAEQPDTLQSVHIAGQRLILSYLREGLPYLQLCTLEGRTVGTIELPGIGAITADEFVNDRNAKHTYYEFSGPAHPPATYRLNLKTGRTSLERSTATDFDSSQYVSRREFARGRYGARIPVKICHRKDLMLNGSNPTILHGYGAAGYNDDIAFNPRIAAWLEMGGIWAVAETRGGGEGGREWSAAGHCENKQNTFNDFIAAAEFLVSAGYTRPSKLAIAGASAGGLLVAVCLTQRPDLFGAAVLFSPSIDVFRFPTLNPSTTTDRGSPSNLAECKAMLDYAPLLNMRSGVNYPHTLVCAREADTTVSPAHAYKFVAALQSAQQGRSMCLLRIEPGARHCGPETNEAWVDETSDWLAFVAQALDIPAANKPG